MSKGLEAAVYSVSRGKYAGQEAETILLAEGY